MRCPHCGFEINDNQTVCPMCGNTLSASQQAETPAGAKRANRIVAIVAALACAVLFFVAASAMGAGGGGAGRTAGSPAFSSNSSEPSSSSGLASSAQSVPASSGGNTVVVSKDLVVYEPGVSPFIIEACDADSVTVTSAEGLYEGAILNAGVTDATPHGLLRKVVSIETQGNRYRVVTAPAALTDAIEQCDIHAVIEVGEDKNYHIREEGAGIPDPLVEQAYAFNYEQNFDMVDETKSFGPAEAFLYDAIEVNIKIDFGSAEVAVLNHLKAGMTIDAKGNISVEDVLLFNKSLKDIHLQIGPVHLVFFNDLNVKANANVKLSLLTMFHTATVDRTIGFRYATGKGVEAINDDNSLKPSTLFSAESAGELFSFLCGAGVSTSLETRLYGLVGFDATLGLQAEVEANLQKIPNSMTRNDALTLPGLGWKAAGSWGIKVWVPLTGSFVAENPFNIFDGGDPLVDCELFTTDDALILYQDGGSYDLPTQNQAESSQQAANSSQSGKAQANSSPSGAGVSSSGQQGSASSSQANGVSSAEQQAINNLNGWWEGSDHHQTMGFQPIYGYIHDGTITWYHYDPENDDVGFVNTMQIVGAERFSENGAEGWRFYSSASTDKSWAYYQADSDPHNLPIYKVSFGYGTIDAQGNNIFAVERYGIAKVGEPGLPEASHVTFFEKAKAMQASSTP